MKRIETLDPNVRLTPQTPQEIYESKRIVEDELSGWLEDVSVKDESLKREVADEDDSLASETVPTKFVSSNSFEQPKIEKPSRIKSYDYRGWDKFDPEQEHEQVKVDATVINPPKKSTIKVPNNLTEEERKLLADKEKMKGNDCMRAQEYDQAVSRPNVARILF
jgi:hypothetical protein